jgi:iron(II)-dependent oxidoreductase
MMAAVAVVADSSAADRPATLAALQRRLLDQAVGFDAEQIRAQYHPLLSPVGWHLRHCAFVEALWIRERLCGDDSLTAPLADQCLPERAAKGGRGAALPDRDALLAWSETTMIENLTILADPPVSPSNGWLRNNNDIRGYVWDFLIHHHAQHLETVRMARTARVLAEDPPHTVETPLTAAAPDWHWRAVGAGRYRIGSDRGFAFDNEGPAQTVMLGDFAIAETPVSNAQYLTFIEQGGYRDQALWSAQGWRWRAGHDRPYAWRRDPAGHWYGLGPDGPRDLDPEAAVDGLSRHEAGAFAAWAGHALPHEYQWEAAAKSGARSRIGEAWEWCANAFHPYPGFRFRPYREYSTPWFDCRHVAMRGASRQTEPVIIRPSFRNYYLADARHHFAGLRLLMT